MRTTVTKYLLGLFITICAITLTSTQADAAGEAFRLGLSATKLDTSYDGPGFGGSSENSLTILGLKAGTYLGRLYVGGVYDSRTDESGSSKTERTGYGATVGYHQGGWFIDGSFYLSSTIKSGSVEFQEGSGFGVDVGRNFNVMSNVFLGLQVSYRSFSYKKVNSVEQENKIKSELTPMLNLGLAF